MVSSTGNDIIVNNGIIQPIDTVLLPPQLASDSITQILLRDDTRFKDLFLALLIAGLTDTLDRKYRYIPKASSKKHFKKML